MHRTQLNNRATLNLRLALVLAPILSFGGLAAQSTPPPELEQLIRQLSERAETIQRMSYEYVEITHDGGVADTARVRCVAEANPNNGMGLDFKAYVPRWNSGISLHDHTLSFFAFGDTTYTQRDVEKEGSEAFSGSSLRFMVNRLPFSAMSLPALLFHSPIKEYSINTSSPSVVIDIHYADTEFIQDNHTEYRFDQRTGLFESSYSTYTDGINFYHREIQYADPQVNGDAVDIKQVPNLPDPTLWREAEAVEQRPDLTVGDTLPGFTPIVKSLDLPQTANGLYVVDVWYFACAPCQKLSPLIEELYQQNREGLAVFGLNLFDDPETITRYQEMKGITFPSYAGRDEREAYTIVSFPKVYLLDERGIILHVIDGYEEDFLERIIPTIDALMK